jgi:hypothetical protein
MLPSYTSSKVIWIIGNRTAPSRRKLVFFGGVQLARLKLRGVPFAPWVKFFFSFILLNICRVTLMQLLR